MREYELTVVYDLAVQEAGGPEASVELLTNVIEARGGKLLKVDHWGRRRMAYPINKVIDADYIVTRVEFEPSAVAPLEATLGIDERIFRHLIVRADELPLPLPPREPRQQPGFVPQSAPVAVQEPAAAVPAEAAVVEAAQAGEPSAPPIADAEPSAAAPAVEAAPAPEVSAEPVAEAITADAPAAEGSPEGVAEQSPADAADTAAAEAVVAAEPDTEAAPKA